MKNLFAIAALLIIILSSCNNNDLEKRANEKKAVLKGIAHNINSDFNKIRQEIAKLAKDIEVLYTHKDETLKRIDKSKYVLSANGVFYKPKNDGKSAVFVSGVFPINQEIMDIVYFTEPIENNFIETIESFPEIVQVYYNDKHSYNRIYPFFDVLAQYEPKMNIPAHNFYYLADAAHNPKKDAVWVNEPYVDPAGRGWMVSAIAPVYFNDQLVGVPGIDVTINAITERYLQNDPNGLSIIIDNTGMIVAAQEAAINLFSFPSLIDHKYIETIKQDTYRKESYNMLNSREDEVKQIARSIINDKKKEVFIEINKEMICVIAEFIPELKWYILEVVK